MYLQNTVFLRSRRSWGKALKPTNTFHSTLYLSRLYSPRCLLLSAWEAGGWHLQTSLPWESRKLHSVEARGPSIIGIAKWHAYMIHAHTSNWWQRDFCHWGDVEEMAKMCNYSVPVFSWGKTAISPCEEVSWSEKRFSTSGKSTGSSFAETNMLWSWKPCSTKRSLLFCRAGQKWTQVRNSSISKVAFSDF